MLSRRLFIAAAPLALAGCSAYHDVYYERVSLRAGGAGEFYPEGGYRPSEADLARYDATFDDGFEVAAVDLRQIDPVFLRQEVDYATAQPVGSVVVDPARHFLYLVQPGGTALRYGVGVGREGFGWSGDATIARKATWPTWTPPAEMVARDPQAAPWADGMPGGPTNPLGARALYLYQDGVDTLYRIHGTNAPRSIGRSMSSGCIRMLNQDVMDLYRRVPTGSRAVVLPAAGEV